MTPLTMMHAAKRDLGPGGDDRDRARLDPATDKTSGKAKSNSECRAAVDASRAISPAGPGYSASGPARSNPLGGAGR
ncbi:hypothetical protein LQ948_16160 [Jiella sp. MQZ9-1]|uniref:Uncharacterized protein n=1 Tax=Jiella flava TaxID=2816857 RepID=A0A939G326_9HYPH|nr:hypothetical protein [Jiella flava]MBO0664169.1 hypothetical protein [Jiella flava]MCD2472741.1 hypothetical protein [Jiella flava]